MNQPKSIEVSAADIESAIDKGIAELGVSRAEIMVEVLEEPSRRLLGLGARQAKVRLTVIRGPSPAPIPTPTPTPAAPPIIPPSVSPSIPPAQTAPQESPRSEQPKVSPPPAPRSESRRDRRPSRAPVRHEIDEDTSEDNEEYTESYIEIEDDDIPARRPTLSPEELVEDARVGAATLERLLREMQIEATITTRAADSSDDEPQHWTLEIQGQELGGLIGRRGETLASLQYITRLIASRELGHRANIVIDVEGYKSRREMMLRRLAQRMAEQALQRGRTVTLEPMPPHERRIIHLELKSNPDVTTESVGEGDRRKVTIVPRRIK